MDHDVLSKFYVPPRCQAISKYSEKNKYSKPIFEVLNEFLTREMASPGCGKNQFFILGDAGMGKTSLLAIIHYFGLTQFWPSSEFTHIEKLGPDSLERIKAMKNSGNCILLLDSLDEDPRSWGRVEERLLELLRATGNFKRVLITCRTQFFPSLVEADGYVGVGPYRCEATYISPFNESEVELYLDKRWPNRWPALLRKLPLKLTRSNLQEREEARQLVAMMGELSSRPLLLANLEDIINAPGSFDKHSFGPAFAYLSSAPIGDFLIRVLMPKKSPKLQSEYLLYKRLVSGWLAREQIKILESGADGPTAAELLEACFRLACFMQKSGRNQRIITEGEIRTLQQLHPELGRLKLMEIGGRSLLNKDGAGNLRFAHYSVQEFLVIRAVLEASPATQEIAEGETFLTTQQMATFFGQAASRHENFQTSLLNLTGKDLSGFDFFSVNFSKASLAGSNLDNAILLKATLNSTDCSYASFREALFCGANLSDAVFSDADLEGATLGTHPAFAPGKTAVAKALGPACLDGASFRNANLSNACLSGCDLQSGDFTGATGLTQETSGQDKGLGK